MLASPANAADYFADVAYDWTGVYGGVHAGFIQANVNVDARPSKATHHRQAELSYERDVDGFVGGALGGVNFQAGNFVFGLDMDFGGVAADGDGTAHAKGTVGGEVIEEDIHFQHGWIGMPMSGAGSGLPWTACSSMAQVDWLSLISMSRAIEACRAIKTSTMAAMQLAGVPAAASNMR